MNDTNSDFRGVLPRTNAILSNIEMNVEDVNDILQTLQIGKAYGDDGIRQDVSYLDRPVQTINN